MKAAAPAIPGYRILESMKNRDEKPLQLICSTINGKAPEGTLLILYPGARQIRVKSRHKGQKGEVLKVRGGRLKDFIPGSVLVDAQWPIRESCKAMLLDDGIPLPKRAEFVHGGIYGDFNKEQLIGRAHMRRCGAFLQIVFPKAYPLMPGMNLWFCDDKRRKLTVFYPRIIEADMLRRLSASVKRRPNPHPGMREIYGRLLHGMGYTELPPNIADAAADSSKIINNWAILESVLHVIEKVVLKTASKPGGIESSALYYKDYPLELLQSVAQDLCRRKLLRERVGWYLNSSSASLSPFHRSWLKKVEDCGRMGLRINSVTKEADLKALEALGRLELIFGGRHLWLSSGAVDAMTESLLAGLENGRRILIADARKSLGGSRSLSLEILEILVNKGRLGLMDDEVTRFVI